MSHEEIPASGRPPGPVAAALRGLGPQQNFQGLIRITSIQELNQVAYAR
ncbi:MAG: hypothetical protein ACE5IB_07945 [Candidatus Geothermarchaeales archaeon]